MKRIFLALLIMVGLLDTGIWAEVSERAEVSPGRSLHQESDQPEIRRYVRALMQRIPVTPGIVVAVVKGGKVIFAEGFGHRNLAAKLPVSTQTGFYIASTTKSFTGTVAKLLAEEGKIDLDAPIKKYLPDLVLAQPLSVELITLRDLLTHRSGISNEAINLRTAYTGEYDSETLLRLLGEFSKPIPPDFRYSNIGYIVASLAMEKATGESWQELVARLIVRPLDLKNTTAYASRAQASGNYATPYISENGTFTELPFKRDRTMHAAGGMISSADDLAKWLIVNVNGGQYLRKQIISSTAIDEVLSPQINQNREYYEFKRYAYGLGWNIGTFNGERFIHCFGEFPGFRPHVSFMPRHKLGVVVLANESAESSNLPDLIAADIYDHIIRKKPLSVDRNLRVDNYIAELDKKRAENRKKAEAKAAGKKADVPSSSDLTAYTGEFINPELGRIAIGIENNILTARFGDLFSALTSSNFETFEAEFLPGDATLIFSRDKGKVRSFSMFGKTFARVN